MAKKAKKSLMEEELEAVSQGKACTKEDAADYILKTIKKHATSITRTKQQYLEENQADMYATYANIESAFDILIDDLKKAGFAL